MNTQAIRQAWLESKLKEVPVTVDIPELKDAHLVIRELPGHAGNELMEICTNQDTKTVDQKKLVAGIILATLRNADDPEKSLIFSEPDRDLLMSTGLGAIMTVAMASINLSGLADKATEDAKKNSSPTRKPSTIVEGSATILPVT